MTKSQTLNIVDGPNKKQLWHQSPIIDDWVSTKSHTQVAVQFSIGTKFENEPFHIYLKLVKTIENDEDSVMFFGQTIDQETGATRYVEGQYNFIEKTGIAQVYEEQRIDDDQTP
ncbi:hypothetical protein KKF84_13235 [Myxococcota bacterium]|nr:hypothetical protein [Myxococcota bacterium]MBU1536282.1 hypothetical protein [Myxococcota bacterium]